MKWGDLGKKLASVGLPALGTAVAGPLGGVVGAAVAAKLGAQADPQAIAEVIDAHPSQALISLREIEARVLADQQAHEAEMLRLSTADIQDARKNTKDDTVRRWMAGPIVIAPVAFAIYILSAQPNDPSSLAMFVLGFLTQQASSVLNFFFGTSIGSVKKQVQLDKQGL